MTDGQKAQLEKQHYKTVGDHSAVKICGWTKNSIRGEGTCYKQKFYNIQSHQCLQMTTSLYCASRCKFCWRGQKALVSKKWYGLINEPEKIIEDSLKAQSKLLNGFGGFSKIDKKIFKESGEVKHVALSLTGESITYPKLNKLLDKFHEMKISTFLVTNAQFPEQIEKIKNLTQLYISLDAPTQELLKKIDNPLFEDYWERLQKSLEIMKTRKYRTCIRLTLIKNENMLLFENYAELIKKAEPDFVELKSYMWVGSSQKYYKSENMPFMDEVRKFSKELLEFLQDYELIDEHEPSRVVLLMKKSLKKKQIINFNKFFELVNSGKDYTTEDYSSCVNFKREGNN